MTLVFNVTVPATTDGTGRSVHIAGFLDRLDGGLPQWDAGATPLTRVDATHWTITFTGKEITQIEYKYTLGDFDHVEKDGGLRRDRQPAAHPELRRDGHADRERHRRRTGATSRPAATRLPRPGPAAPRRSRSCASSPRED